MKIKKTVTSKFISANQKRAKKSPGPKTERGKRSSAANRRSHGLLARTVVFADDDEKAQYNELLELWTKGCDPDDMTEAALVKQIVDTQWRLQQSTPWESAAIRTRRLSSLSIVRALEEEKGKHSAAPDLPFVSSVFFQNALPAWECAELTLTSGQSNDVTPTPGNSTWSTQESAGNQVGIGVKLASSLDTVMRYRSTITKALSRWIELLDRHRAQRNEGG